MVYTIPHLASVGLQEHAARDQGLRFQTHHANTSKRYSSRRVAEKYAGYKVLVEEDSDHILGAHLLGPGSDEIINMFALAISLGLRATDLKEAIYAYPTHASDIPQMV